ncbi:glycosyl hydrolase family 28-related protein [Psychrobacillus sp. OK032]|uniref:glycosyl hydrolase family 28-related protein n=1 Tax=Psychrobacillus sp. OK032 TaxID=1884358 RepID=UPI0008B31C60|nr:glycosyl hydrolase family 28-related protein [Psychrobacillus sp. OK032]SER71686.1 hypothetical protein SAMN05518872_101739 [Psychrobacillus sp. OK032]
MSFILLLYISNVESSLAAENTQSMQVSGYIDLNNFGAVGDGKTDDTEAFKQAAQQEGIIRLEPGKIYLISSTIKIDLTNIKGIQANNAKILLSGDFAAFHLKGNKTNGGAEPLSNVGLEQELSPVIEQLHVYSNNHEGTALILDGTFGVNISKSHFYKLKKGIEVINRNRNVIITENHLWDIAEYGIHYNNVNLHQSIITNNHISYAKIAMFFENGDVHNIQINSNDIEVGYSINNNTQSAIQVVCDKPDTQFSQAQIVGNSIEDHFLAKEGIIYFYSKVFDPSAISSDKAPYIGMIELLGNEFSGASKALVLDNIHDLTVNGNTFKLITEAFISIYTGAEGINISGNTFSGRVGKNYGGKVLSVEGGKAGVDSALRFLNFNNNTAYNLSDNPISIKGKEGVKDDFKVSELSISNNIFSSSSRTGDSVNLTGYMIDINVSNISGVSINSNIITGGRINENGLRLSAQSYSNMIVKDNIISGLIARKGSTPIIFSIPKSDGKSIIVKDNIPM